MPESCPHIPLKDLRWTDLREFIHSFLEFRPDFRNAEIYEAVLLEFGEEICQPEVMCPHDEKPRPEYQHVVRFALNDGRRDSEFVNTRRGRWSLVNA